jgi:hypothetical protein
MTDCLPVLLFLATTCLLPLPLGIGAAHATRAIRATISDILGRPDIVLGVRPWSCNLCMSLWSSLAGCLVAGGLLELAVFAGGGSRACLHLIPGTVVLVVWPAAAAIAFSRLAPSAATMEHDTGTAPAEWPPRQT